MGQGNEGPMQSALRCLVWLSFPTSPNTSSAFMFEGLDVTIICILAYLPTTSSNLAKKTKLASELIDLIILIHLTI